MAKLIQVDDFTDEIDAILVDDDALWRKIERSSGSNATLSLTKEVHHPFEYEGVQHVTMGSSSIPCGDGGRYDVCYAYQIVPRSEFKDEVYGKYDHPDFAEGFYHRRYCYLNGQMHVLLGPELPFVKITQPPFMPDKTQLTIPPVIIRAIGAGAAIAASVSGGKDSEATANMVAHLRDTQGLQNRIFAIHMDLGRAEWNETPLHVEKIASSNNLPLVVVSRPQGDLVQEIEERMLKLKGTGKPFWPSSAARYCTADQKRSQADKHYRQFDLIVSAEGNRAEESPKRRKDDPVSVRKQITAKPLRDLPVDEALDTWIAVNRLLDVGDDTAVAEQYPQFTRYSADNRPRLAITWYPIHDWRLEDVWYACGTSASDLAMRQAMYQSALGLEDSGSPDSEVDRIKRKALKGWPCHPAYVYGNERLSCALCILANDNDLRNGARHQPELAAHYIHLEEVGGATFKNGRSLQDILNGG